MTLLNEETDMTDIEEAIQAIRDAYPESVWKPIPSRLRAKDAVAADLLRRMAPAMVAIILPIVRAHDKAVFLKIVGEDESEDYDPRDEDPDGRARNRLRATLRTEIEKEMK
jgi:hypothetical protein